MRYPALWLPPGGLASLTREQLVGFLDAAEDVIADSGGWGRLLVGAEEEGLYPPGMPMRDVILEHARRTVTATGSHLRAALALGVDPSTVGRWTRGGNPMRKSARQRRREA